MRHVFLIEDRPCSNQLLPSAGPVLGTSHTMRKPRSIDDPLVVAALAAAIGGVGNTAFSLHSGNSLGLALPRFGFGLLVVSIYARTPRIRAHVPAEIHGQPRSWAHAAGFFEALSVILLMAAAQHTTTLVFSLFGALSPALVALGSRLVSLPQASGRQAAIATTAVLLATASAMAGGTTARASALGLVLAALSTVSGAVATVSAAKASRALHPVVVVRYACGWGVGLCTVMALAGSKVSAPLSTLVVAIFIALIPGGLAKIMMYSAASRTAPQLVSASSALSVFTAAASSWLLLHQRPGLLQGLLAAMAAMAAVLLAASPRIPGRDPCRSRRW